MNPDIKKNLAYLFSYKFRNMFFILFFVFIYVGLAEEPIYFLYAFISLGLGIYANKVRNKIVKK
ncbi:hypothetical protein ACFLZ6_01390 [Nanoarchaeota archaeon]